MPGRSTTEDMLADAARVLAQAAHGAGIGVTPTGPLTLTLPDGRAVSLHLQTRAVVDEATASRLARTARRPAVVVADLISADARAVLEKAGVGWLDRRGHLRLVAPGVFIDRDVGPLPRATRVGAEPVAIRGAASMGVSAAHLIGSGEGVRQLASTLRLSPAAISKARSSLAASGLLDDGPDARRALFWMLADAWHPAWADLLGTPAARVDLTASGTRAAAALGAPIIVTTDYPVELYAADASTLERARLMSPRSGRGRSYRVAVAPTPLVAAARPASGARVRDWPITHPLFVGLDLAADPARGQEALEAWEPPGWARAW